MSKVIVKLGEICEIKGGKRLPKGSDFSETGYPYIRARDIKNGRVTFDSPVFINDELRSRLQRYKVKANDICVTIVGINVGDTGIVPASLDDANLTENAAKLTNLNGILPHYLNYYLLVDGIKEQLKAYSTGSAQDKLALYKLGKLDVILPSISNQQKIAGILSAYDELIENNKKRIALLETMAEELYKEWFVRFRFPNYENTEFEKAVPKDWLERPTSELFEILGGGTPSKDEEEYWKDGEINWFTPSDLTKGSSLFIENSELKCNETGLSKSSAKLFPAFSIMMTSRATIGVLSINTTEACTNQGFITCIPNEKFPLTYLYFWLKFTKPYFDILANGATFAELSRGSFKKIKMRVPSQEIIDKFESFCRPIFDEILTLQRELENLSKQKNQLLPRLISGKLSVENLDIQQPSTPAQPTDNE